MTDLLTGAGGEAIDIVLSLGTLRPTEAYHWKGGAINDYDNIGEWRESGKVAPTQQEIIVSWETTDKDIVINSLDPENRTAWLAAYNGLVLGIDINPIFTAPADDTATITSNDPVIAGDAAIDWNVWFNGVIIDSGAQALVAGALTLTFVSGDTGVYLLEIKRQGPTDYETGYIEIEVLDHA